MKKTKSPAAKTAAPKTASATASPPRSQPRAARQDQPRSGGSAAPQALTAAEQVALFDRAVALFQKGSVADARALFERAASGPVREVAHSARVHAEICARRAGEPTPEPATADEHYNLAIALLNRRDLATAEQHLTAAASMAPDADHILYALALAKGLRGQLREAAESLRRAIHLNPRNRSQARHDPDFAPLVQEPLLAAVLRGDGEPIA